MNQQQKSKYQAYFHIINRLFVSHCKFDLVHIVCIIKKMTTNFETKSILNITYIYQKLIRYCPSTSLDHKILLIDVFKVNLSD